MRAKTHLSCPGKYSIFREYNRLQFGAFEKKEYNTQPGKECQVFLMVRISRLVGLDRLTPIAGNLMSRTIQRMSKILLTQERKFDIDTK